MLNTLSAFAIKPPLETPLLNENGVFVKYEGAQIKGSVKYRMVFNKVLEAIGDKGIDGSSILIEASAGSTGVALSEVAAQIAARSEIHMYDNADPKKMKQIKDVGGQIVLHSACIPFPKIMDIISAKMKEGEYWHLNQMDKKSVVQSYENFAYEISDQLGDTELERFVCPVGTGGVIQGVGSILKKRYPKLKIIAVEPAKEVHIDGLRNTEELHMGEQDPYDKTFPDMRIEVAEVTKNVKFQDRRLGDSASTTLDLIRRNNWDKTLMIAAD